MDTMLRLFIAIDLPDAVKLLLHEIQQRLRQHAAPIRWADPQGTHLTLKFLGDTRADAVPAIVEGLEHAAARHPPFRLQTADVGVFPNLKRPRVVWLGVSGDMDKLRRLHSAVEQFVAPLGFPSEQRPFAPHLTLGRSGKEPRAADLLAIGAAVQQTTVPRQLTFDVTALILMRSELRAGGAQYSVVAHLPLDAAS